MARIVRGVEAAAGEDLTKAVRLIQRSRAKIHHTSKRAGTNSGADKELGAIVRRLERVIVG